MCHKDRCWPLLAFSHIYITMENIKGKHHNISQMELQQITIFPFILSLFIIFIFLLKQLRKSNQSSILPPGPTKLPLIGHLHHLFGGLPHHSLRDLAYIHGPLMHLQLGQISAVIVSSPAVAKQMMTTHDLAFSDRAHNLAAKIMTYDGRDLALAPYGEFWRQLRKVCILELLSAKRVQSFWSVREDEVLNLIRSISPGSPFNLSLKIFTLSNDITLSACIGRTCKDKEAFLCLVEEFLKLSSGFSIPDLFPSMKFLGAVTGMKPIAEKLHRKTDEMLDEIISEHVERRMSVDQGVEEDLVGVLLRIQESGVFEFPITMENVKAVVLDILIAGTDTSATLMDWTFSELLRNPRVMKKAQAEVRRIFNGKGSITQADVNELSYLRLVIKETLRLHPPGPLLVPRECRERCEVEGYEIPKGTKVIVNAWAMGRDPKNWRDPDKFEPERFQDISVDYKGTNYEYTPFGAGRRMCPGILFGMASVELSLAMLLYHFNWQTAYDTKPEDLDMSEAFGAIVRRKSKLYVVPTPYNP